MSFWQSIEDELQAATVPVLRVRGDADVIGTAIALSPAGVFVTAGHLFVVQHAEGDTYAIRTADGAVREIMLREHEYDDARGRDYAIFTVAELSRHAYATAAFPRQARGALELRGYGRMLVEQSTAKGTFTGRLDIRGQPGDRLFQYQSQQAGDIGFSGSGIYSAHRGAVVAIQTEAVPALTGPHHETVLGFPLWHIRSALRAHAGWGTQVSWLVSAAMRALAYRPLRYLGLAAMFALVVGLGYFGIRLSLTYQQLSRFSDPVYVVADVAETDFWTVDAGVEYTKMINAEQIDHEVAIVSFIEKEGMKKTILTIDKFYEEAAECVNGGRCLADITCGPMYKKLWDFHHVYYPLLNKYYNDLDQLGTRPLSEYLSSSCESQRVAICTSVNNEGEFCPPPVGPSH